MKIHPVAELFPMLSASELSEMADSIKREGLLNPCVRQGDTLLDGRNRIAACKLAGVEPRFIEYVGDDVTGFIIGQNIHRRHLDESQRAMVAARLATLKDGQRADLQGAQICAAKSQPEAAKMLNVSRRGVQNARQVIENGTPELVKAVDEGRLAVSEAVKVAKAEPETQRAVVQKVIERPISSAKAVKEVKAEQNKRDLEEARQDIDRARKERIESVCDLRVCSCAELFASGIKPDAVITDPPYPQEFLPVFTELAEGCKLAGVPLVAVMSGQSYLPEVMRRLCEHLRYRWTLAYMTPGGQSVQQWQAKVNTSWKPVILFGDAVEWFGDVAVSKPNDNDKRFHGWGQSESGMADLVERLTKPGQLVCDPFLGGGTTAVVSLALGRRFVGCDIDSLHVEHAKARVMA
jgi:site-specific DNA-methyltransferase (adenine-specific)